jgi:hypothetical protein
VDASCEARFVTTQPGQALAMLHGEFVHEQAGKLAERVAMDAGPTLQEKVDLSLRIALQRPATKEELADGVELLERFAKEHGQSDAEALRYWCLAVFNTNEFSYLD